MTVTVAQASIRYLAARGPTQRSSMVTMRYAASKGPIQRTSTEGVRYLATWSDPAAKLHFTTTYVEVLAISQADLQSGDAILFKREMFPYNISYNSIATPTFADDVVVVDSGVSQRISRWDQPLMEYDVAYGVRTMEQLHALVAFFRAMRGRQYGFLFYDPTDHTSSIPTAIEAREAPIPHFTDQTIGIGDSAKTQFQLVKVYTPEGGTISSSRPITKPMQGGTILDLNTNGRPPAYPVTIGINGVQQLSGWSVDYDTGLVTFSSAPTGSQVITAGYEFFVPVTFNTSRISVSLDDYGVGKGTEIKLIEIRPAEAVPT